MKRRGEVLRSAGLGLITGAADDDPSAIGTYASAGAAFGPAFLWTAPVTFPMMFAVVFLSAKLGQVTGQGLFAVLRKSYPRWVLYPTLAGVLVGNTIEAAADLGGIAAALGLLVHVPLPFLVVAVAAIVLLLQVRGSYTVIRNTFRVLALALLAYVPAALLAKPGLGAVIRGTLVPTIHLDRHFLSMLVAVIGTTLSGYLLSWQSNEEVEEKIEQGRTRVEDRRGATRRELDRSKRDILFGMLFSNVIMFFVMLSTSATLYRAGRHEVASAADAARALVPLAGGAAGVLFALGLVGVGFLAIPVMTGGAAYDASQTFGWKHGLGKRPEHARAFYAVIVGCTLAAVALNFVGVNPMKALVFAGIVQGLSTPPLMLLVMLLTNDRKIMAGHVNAPWLNVLGWLTTAAMFAAGLGLIVSWIVHGAGG